MRFTEASGDTVPNLPVLASILLPLRHFGFRRKTALRLVSAFHRRVWDGKGGPTEALDRVIDLLVE
jgi:hypothetical protein